jgi:7-cyano-7-deazaguanine reductase
MTTELKKGEKEIQKAELLGVKNHYPDRNYEVSITLPEFTCKCPMYGYPDFATIHVTYVPDQLVIELKSIKLYINKFRDEYVFHEEIINRILDDLVNCIKPRYMKVVGDFNPRGNVKTVVTVEHRAENFSD